MKSVVQAAWLMTSAVGSLVVVVVAQSHFFTSQVSVFVSDKSFYHRNPRVFYPRIEKLWVLTMKSFVFELL